MIKNHTPTPLKIINKNVPTTCTIKDQFMTTSHPKIEYFTALMQI